MNNFLCLVASAAAFPFSALARPELVVTPSEKTIHVAEPVVYELVLRNTGESDVKGRFDLDGRDAAFRIRWGKSGGKHRIFYNESMWAAEFDDRSVRWATLAPQATINATHIIHYNRRPRSLVFADPGDYVVSFKLIWNRKSDGSLVPETDLDFTSKIKVLAWDPIKDKRQLDALALWSDPSLASYIQNGGKPGPDVEAKLRLLANDHGDTLYGGLAAKALANSNAAASPLLPSGGKAQDSHQPSGK